MVVIFSLWRHCCGRHGFQFAAIQGLRDRASLSGILPAEQMAAEPGDLPDVMDLAGAIAAREVAKGRVTTVAAGRMAFLCPVPVGSTVSCYCEILSIGRASITCLIEVWVKQFDRNQLKKVTEAEFVYVAIDDNGRTRPISS